MADLAMIGARRHAAMVPRSVPLAALALVCLGNGRAGEQPARLLRYKPVSKLSYVTVTNRGDEIRVRTIDSSEAVPGQDAITVKWRGGNISSKSPLRFEPYRITSRGGIPRSREPTEREIAAMPPRLAKLVRTCKTRILEKSIRGDTGFPLLPEREVRPGDRWQETYVMGIDLGEAAWVIPVRATFKYIADRTVQGRKCAILSFRLSGELLFDELPLPAAKQQPGAKRTIDAQGELAFDYGNGCDVRLRMKTIERETSGRGDRPVERTWTVLKMLSEMPLLGPRPAVPEGVPGHVMNLSDPDPEVRADAAYALRKNRTSPETAVPALIRLLNDENEGVRSNAANALDWYGKEVGRALPQLIEVLETTADSNIQESIIDHLVDLGDKAKPAIPALAKVIIDEKGNVSTSAMGLLGTFGPDSAVAVPNLIKVLNRPDPDRDYRFVRAKAVSVLGLIGPKARSALPALERLRGEKWSSMRNRARLAIRRIRGEGGAEK